MPIALGVMIGLYIWIVLRRTRSGTLPPAEIARLDRLMRFLRLGLVVVSLVTAALMIWTSNTRGIRTEESGDLMPVVVVAGTIISYALTLAAVVWCVVYYRNRVRLKAGTPEP